MFDNICRNITWPFIYDQTRYLDYEVPFCHQLIRLHKYMFDYLITTVFLIIRRDKIGFSLFHEFSKEFLPNDSYVVPNDVQSLNHMNVKYVEHDWNTDATV